MTSVQWFNPGTASWADAVDANSAGAYRVGRYAPRYFVRTERDLENGTLAHAPAYLAKHHAASSLAGRALMAYSSATRSLVVPLGGARLPRHVRACSRAELRGSAAKKTP